VFDLRVICFWCPAAHGLLVGATRGAVAGGRVRRTAAPLDAVLYGLDYGSYVWRGFGTYTQLWGIISFIGTWRRTQIAHRRGPFLAVVALSLLVLSHLLYGYMARASACCSSCTVAIAVIGPRPRDRGALTRHHVYVDPSAVRRVRRT
jgi:hypothetical protein